MFGPRNVAGITSLDLVESLYTIKILPTAGDKCRCSVISQTLYFDFVSTLVYYQID